MSTADPLILFGSAHVISILLIAAVGIGLPLSARRATHTTTRYRIGLAIAALLVLQEGVHIWLLANHYDRLLSSLLPLHLCGLSVLLTAWTLAARSYSAYEIVYFWAWGGTLQALLTPDLDRGFPDPAFIAFFIGHGLVIVGVLYATLVYRFRPRLSSIFKSLAALLLVVAVVAPINLWLGTNYLFLCSKPEQASLMDLLGPWPWYILSLAGLALVSSFVYYLPFPIADRIAARSRANRPSPRSPEA